jgi:hypothetical protein
MNEEQKPFNIDNYQPEPLHPSEEDPRIPNAEESAAQAGLTPEQLASAETAVGAIAGVGATALAKEVQAPGTEANQTGFLRRAGARVKNGLKQAWNEHPAVKAITEAGGTFSKWEVAKVVGHKMFVDTPAVMMLGLKDQLMLKKPEAARRRADLARSGATSGTLSRKMAEGLSEGPIRNNSVRTFLERSDAPSETKQAVLYARERMEWVRKHPDEAMQQRLAGACVIALAASSAILAYKGLIDHDTAASLRDITPK